MDIFNICSGIVICIVICCGMFGNALSFIVWTKGRRCKKLPGGIYLRALAVSDTVALGIPAVNLAVTLLTGFGLKEEYNFVCKLEITGRHFGLLVSTWIIVCFTLERTLAIFRTATSIDLIGKKGTIALMIVIFVVNFFLNLPFGIVHEVTQEVLKEQSHSNFSLSNFDENFTDTSTADSFETETIIVGYKKRCLAVRSSFFHYLNWYHIWFMDVFLIFIIPFSIITASNLTVLYRVIRSKNATHSKFHSKIKAVTMRAVTIGVVHCVTSGPFSMSVLIPGYFDRALNVKNSQEYYINRVTLILAYMNHAINFLFYSVFGSDFRRDCAELFWKKPTAVHPDSTSLKPNRMTDENTSGTRNSRLNNRRENSKTCTTAVSCISE